MTEQPLRIKFFARSFDLRLYERSRLFYRTLGYPCVRLTDQSADGYFFAMLRHTDCDIAINVDEDCFITHPDRLFRLVDKVIDGGYINAGCPDGGAAAPRGGNPIVTNPFFNILNLKLMRQIFAKQNISPLNAVKAFDYNQHKQLMIKAFPSHMLAGKWDFNNKNYVEPYYPFFLFLAFHGKTLYLPTRRHQDQWSTILCDPDGMTFCVHSWLARFYATPACIAKIWQKDANNHRQRIDNLIEQTAQIRHINIPKEKSTDTIRYAMDMTIRWSIKIPQRIAGWPNKIKKRILNSQS